ncbi:MIR domain protein [Ichthyophthirius multifiliis]|uniref:MIR domain protein n=1 Tax=Ichthyophthirius multifiliis TaxID=5932 RepID=G0QMJ6_ICHMU|nr:MIR domain protein [Ichthyophthirius multifiliis]EGR33562.1 MIR domain protein [Ichthyophthirius multifiliis]|eukprot:XP_004037548.1 MIR domain protein [Ichthyophthirius multifiliis]
MKQNNVSILQQNLYKGLVKIIRILFLIQSFWNMLFRFQQKMRDYTNQKMKKQIKVSQWKIIKQQILQMKKLKTIMNQLLQKILEFNQQKMIRIIGVLEKIYEKKNDINKFAIHLAEIARLKYKCLITVVSLLECNDSRSDFIMRIMRIIPVKVLTENLTKIYQLYQKYTKDDYNDDLFNTMDKDIEEGDHIEEKQSLIIENGFHLYTLIKLYISNKEFDDLLDDNDEDMNAILDEFKQEDDGILQSIFNKDNLFGNMAKLGIGFKDDKQEEMYKLKQKQDKKLLIKNVQKIIIFKYLYKLKQALQFFKQKTCQIEIIRDGELQTIYFPKLPLCFTLADEVKDDFNNQVDRSSTKAKITCLMNQSDRIIRIMKHEERVRRLVNTQKIIGFIVNNHKLLENLSFCFAIAINLIVIGSYSNTYFDKDYFESKGIKETDAYYQDSLQYTRLRDPRFFGIEKYKETGRIIQIIGLINLALVSIVVAFFLIKRAPLIVENIWKNFFKGGYLNILQKFIQFIINTLRSIYLCLQDFDIIYYCLQLCFALIGLTYHPFLFAGLLSDFLRFDILSNVVKAIYEPKIEMGLSLLLFIILEYYFTIVSYTIFYNQYAQYQDCESFWRCYFKTFDYTFKETGAVGIFLNNFLNFLYIFFFLGKFLFEENSLKEVGGNQDDYNGVNQNLKSLYFERFAFDNLLNIVLVLIVMNMIGGIIIDKFKELKDKLDSKIIDENKYCFICGLDRQTLDKGSEQGGFFYHIKVEHKQWNYIFYQAYLKQKQTTEFNGNESYIYKKINNFDISWIPKKRTKQIKDIQDLEEEKMEIVGSAKNNIKNNNNFQKSTIIEQNSSYLIHKPLVACIQYFHIQELTITNSNNND